jgi:hypothetical protein
MADIETDESSVVIASNKVQGTAVYDPNGGKIGSIFNFMVNKLNGQVEYAVLQFGGILGVGSDYYPLPWNALKYDKDKGGYVVYNVSKDALINVPHFAPNEEPPYTQAYGEEVSGAWGLPVL